MKPKISIIVPVYNTAEYLSTTVESLLKQTYPNIEIVLVDDGSTDESPRICDELERKHENIKAIHIANSGVSPARNAGIDTATGEFIGFCDSDDVIDEDMYELLYGLIEEDGSDMSMCELRFVYPDGSVKEIATGERKTWNSPADFLQDFLSGKVEMSVDTKLFRKSSLGDLRFPYDIKINEDKYFCFIAALNSNKISGHNLAKYNYYRHPGSSSINKFDVKYFEGKVVADLILDRVRKDYPSLIELAEGQKLTSCIRTYKLVQIRGGYRKYPDKEKELTDYIRSFDRKKAKKLLTKGNYVRFRIIRISRSLFRLFTKFVDKH